MQASFATGQSKAPSGWGTGMMASVAVLLLANAAAGSVFDVPDAGSNLPDEAAQDARRVAERFDPYVAMLDAAGVTYIEGGASAVYMETAERRWLCVRREGAGVGCYPWPGNAPRVSVGDTFYGAHGTLLDAFTDTHRLKLSIRTPGTKKEYLFVGRVRCESSGDELAYTMPPSRRPKQRAVRCDRKAFADCAHLDGCSEAVPRNLARALADLDTGQDTGLRVRITSVQHGGMNLVSIGEGSNEQGWFGFWTCHRQLGRPRVCGKTDLSSFRAIHPESTVPANWLLLAYAGYNRSGTTTLVWVTASEGVLRTAQLEIGATSGYGESCESLLWGEGIRRSYCVFIAGNWTPYEILSPSCVRIGRTLPWTAVRVRAQDRWIKEKVRPAHAEDEYDIPGDPPASGTYRAAADGWKLDDCSSPRGGSGSSTEDSTVPRP